jgi:hypothetical protein
MIFSYRLLPPTYIFPSSGNLVRLPVRVQSTDRLRSEEECDGIEDTLSDNGREPRTNRQGCIIGAFQEELGKAAM